MGAHVLSNMQKELLKLYSTEIPDSQLQEIKQLLSRYFADKASDEMDRLWDEQKWNDQTMNQWSMNTTGVRVVIDTNVLFLHRISCATENSSETPHSKIYMDYLTTAWNLANGGKRGRFLEGSAPGLTFGVPKGGSNVSCNK